MNFCIQCGNELSAKERYCSSCGRKVKHSFLTKKRVLIVIGVLILLFGGVIFLDEDVKNESENVIESVMRELKEEEQAENTDISSAVVNVLCPYAGEEISFESSGTGGSGTVIDEEGFVLTNAHIIPQDDDQLNINEKGCIVVFPDQKTGLPREAYLAWPIVLKGISDEYDLAILEINDSYKDKSGEIYGKFPKKFYSVNNDNCDEEDLQLGEAVRIYGYPEGTGGYSLTVTDGIVSAFSNGMVFTSAKIDMGNSGGLATDEKGCFIGVPSAVKQGNYESYGLIISASQVRDFIDKLVSSVEKEE